MKTELKNICHLVKDKISVSEITSDNYISTENMLPNKCGITAPSSVPTGVKVTAYRKNDILVSNIRPYFKKIWFAEYNGGCSNDVLVFRAEEGISPEFLYYTLADDGFFDYAMKTSKGTKMPRGDKKAIMEYAVNVPDYETQKKTSHLLRLLDRKIELNNKINQNLEEQAQAIYKSWFAGFEANGILSDIADITMGQSPKGTSYNQDKTGIIFFQGRTDFRYRFPNERIYTTEPKKFAEKNDILMSVRAPVGDLNIANQKCCIGRGLASVRSKDNHSSFLFYTLLNIKNQLNIFNGQGTVFGSINQKSLKELSIVIPPYELLEKFEKIISRIDKKIENNYSENQRLSVLRDTLIAKLINEEIDVSKIQI